MKKEKIDDGTNDLENFLNSSYYQLIDIKMKMARSYFNEKNIKNVEMKFKAYLSF